MHQIIAVNGSPRMEKGYTQLLLDAFLQGMTEAGADVETVFTSRLNIKPCACGRLYCWNDKPGECCIQDDMQPLYPKLKSANILVLATPVYIPLPGDFQNFINRLCPLLDPVLEMRRGRTRARMRADVKIQKMVLVATSGWWEVENMDTVLKIIKELAEDASVEFSGALLRPHSSVMKSADKITPDGQSVLNAARTAGSDLIRSGSMNPDTLAAISRPLISPEDFLS